MGGGANPSLYMSTLRAERLPRDDTSSDADSKQAPPAAVNAAEDNANVAVAAPDGLQLAAQEADVVPGVAQPVPLEALDVAAPCVVQPCPQQAATTEEWIAEFEAHSDDYQLVHMEGQARQETEQANDYEGFHFCFEHA